MRNCSLLPTAMRGHHHGSRSSSHVTPSVSSDCSHMGGSEPELPRSVSPKSLIHRNSQIINAGFNSLNFGVICSIAIGNYTSIHEPLNHPFIPFHTHSLTYSLIYPLIHVPTCPFIYSFTHPLTHLSTLPPSTHSSTTEPSAHHLVNPYKYLSNECTNIF